MNEVDEAMKWGLRKLHLFICAFLLGIFVSSAASDTIYRLLAHTGGFVQQYAEDDVHILRCSKCSGHMKVISFIDQPFVIRRFLEQLEL